jgi:hypothetical protein
LLLGGMRNEAPTEEYLDPSWTQSVLSPFH